MGGDEGHPDSVLAQGANAADEVASKRVVDVRRTPWDFVERIRI